jgi:hypothetical protein
MNLQNPDGKNALPTKVHSTKISADNTLRWRLPWSIGSLGPPSHFVRAHRLVIVAVLWSIFR